MDTTSSIIESIFTLSRVMKEKMGGKSQFAHLSMVQLQTLVFLKKNPKSSMRSVADFLRVELPSATNLIEKLVKLQLVERRLDAQDKRWVRLSLTQKGMSLLVKAKKERQKNMEKLLSHLTDKEKETLLFLFEKLTSIAKQSYGK